MFDITAIQAEQGDALLVSYGDPDDPWHILVDGGVTESLDNVLAALEKVRKHGRLRLEALVVTHYDTDHIGGIIALLEDKPNWLEIGDIWFNGKKHIQPPDVLGPSHGNALTDLIDSHHPWNSAFGNGCLSSAIFEPVKLAGGMQVWVLSPDEPRLLELAHEWTEPMLPVDDSSEHEEEDLLGHKDVWPLPPFSEYRPPLFRADASTPNGSSIALMLEYGEKRALLTGDAFAGVVAEGLASRWDLPVVVELLKVSHHGSKRNTNRELLQYLDCSRYLISSSGRQHAHPDQALIALLIAERPGAEIIFNYVQPQTSAWRDVPPDWPEHQLTFPKTADAWVTVHLS
jgi:hypothetical protein